MAGILSRPQYHECVDANWNFKNTPQWKWFSLLVAVWFNIKSGDDMSLGGTKLLPDP